MTNTPNPIGRPTDYTLELSDKICARLACGESMRAISRDDSMPCMTTLFKWLREIPAFTQQYEKAKEESADAMAEESLDIADNQVEQPLIVDGLPLQIDGKPVMVKDAVSVAHAKLRIDTRKWYASKLKAKKYGDRVHTEHSGSIQTTDMSDEELTRKLAELEQARASSAR
ncbi:MAG: DNA packaging protein [Pseudomonadota bacterium]